MKVVIAITGASGILYGTRLYDALKKQKDVQLSLVISEAAKITAKYEKVKLPKADYSEKDFSAPFVSGSNPVDAFIIAPCSLNTLGKVASGISDNIITRGSEVALKEKRRLILLIRDTPLSLIAIENMRRIAAAGGVIMPASPGFYNNPKSPEDLADFMVFRIMDHLGIKHKGARWGK